MGLDVSQRFLLDDQALVLGRIGQLGPGQLVDLVPEKVDLARPRPRVTAQCCEGVLEAADALAGDDQWLEVDRRVPVECGPLRRTGQQALVGVLAVEIHQQPAVLGQLGHRRQTAVDVGPRPPLCRDDPAEDHLVLAHEEAALHDGLARPRSYQARLGPPSDEEGHGFDEEGLAGAGLPGHGGQARTEEQARLADHPQVTHHELAQHQRSARPNLAFRI